MMTSSDALRNDADPLSPEHSVDNAWQAFSQTLSSTHRKFHGLLCRIDELSNFVERPSILNDRVSSSSTSSLVRTISVPEEQAKVSCMVLPGIKTSRWFDRIDVIEEIDDHFNRVGSNTSLRSIGLAGVGKSFAALRYAGNKIRQGELDAMFWVNSEKLVTIRQSFTDIAMLLKLPGARPKDHDENHVLVLSWLQYTRKFIASKGDAYHSSLYRLPLAHRV